MRAKVKATKNSKTELQKDLLKMFHSVGKILLPLQDCRITNLNWGRIMKREKESSALFFVDISHT